jgi:hypothetical protein
MSSVTIFWEAGAVAQAFSVRNISIYPGVLNQICLCVWPSHKYLTPRGRFLRSRPVLSCLKYEEDVHILSKEETTHDDYLNDYKHII